MVQVAAWRSAVEWCKRLSWRSLRFPALFLVSVALLTIMYRLRSDRIDKEEAEKALLVTKAATYVVDRNVPRSVPLAEGGGPSTPLWTDEAELSEVASHERWVVVSGGDAEEGTRGALGACSVAAAAKARGWRAIVIGEGLRCCRLPECIPMDRALLSRLPYRVLRHDADASSPLRNAAFLFAIQHGARFLFDAYPPGVGDRKSLASWADEVFSSMVLGSSVGLVLDGYSHSFPTPVPGAPTPRVLNPYAHFGRPDLWARGYDVAARRAAGPEHQHHHAQHLRYRVCEIRQPSVEMFLDVWDGGPADLVAPPVTVPVNVLAPHGSRNVLYTRDALWGLALLPERQAGGPQISPHLARALWNHALLGATSDAGGVRFTLLPSAASARAPVPATDAVPSVPTPAGVNDTSGAAMQTTDASAYVATFTSRVLRWRCRCATLLPCLSQMTSDFLSTSLLTVDDAAMLEAWVSDLRRVRYLPPPALPWSPRPPPRPSGPCIHPPHHHHRQSHDPPLPHPTTLTFHPSAAAGPGGQEASLKRLIARFHRDAALLEWSESSERTEEEVSLVEETLAEDGMMSEGEEGKSGKVREDNLSRRFQNRTVVEIEEEDTPIGGGEETPEGVTETPEVPSRTFLGDVADHICPGFAPLAAVPRRSSLDLKHVLLVVWFPRPPRYDLLPTLELIRSRHFPNALFCGPPHRALPSMLSRFEAHASPSFLTATSRSDCLLTALEMGYRIGEGGSVLLVEESALPVPWMMAQRDRSLLWFHVKEADGDSPLGPRSPEELVATAAEGLASSLRFMARLMGVRPSPHLHPHHHPMEDDETLWGGGGKVAPSEDKQGAIGDDRPTEANETVSISTALPAALEDSENATITEQPESTAEVNDVVKEDQTADNVTLPVPGSDSPFAAVDQVDDTPSVEYSEPVKEEYGRPKVVEAHQIHEVIEGADHEFIEKVNDHNLEKISSVEHLLPPSVIHITTSEDLVLNATMEKEETQPSNLENTTQIETLRKELEEAVAIVSDVVAEADSVNGSTTEWPSLDNSSTASWEDDDASFDLPSNFSSSDWVTGSEAEEVLSSITMNSSEGNTEDLASSNSEETVTEYLVGDQGNVTLLLDGEAGRNETLQRTFDIKSTELYDEDGEVEEQSLGETLLSYKDVGEGSPFISNLPFSASKSIEGPSPHSEEDDQRTRRRRRKRSAGEHLEKKFPEGVVKRQTEDSVQLGELPPRLSQSLQEIEELFSELAREFPEDAEVVSIEGGNLSIMHRHSAKHYGLDHTDFRHLHCDYGEEEDDVSREQQQHGDEGDYWGGGSREHFEPCSVLRRFFLRLHMSHQSVASILGLLRLATTRGLAPVFHLPMRLQRELHLTASLLLSQGFPEEAVLPLLVYGLAGESGWVNLKKGAFVDVGGPFLTLDDKADFIHPTNLRVVGEEPRLRSVFCLKFLLKVLDG